MQGSLTCVPGELGLWVVQFSMRAIRFHSFRSLISWLTQHFRRFLGALSGRTCIGGTKMTFAPSREPATVPSTCLTSVLRSCVAAGFQHQCSRRSMPLSRCGETEPLPRGGAGLAPPRPTTSVVPQVAPLNRSLPGSRPGSRWWPGSRCRRRTTCRCGFPGSSRSGGLPPDSRGRARFRS